MAGRPLRRARMNPNEYTKAQYPYEVFYQRKVKGKITSGSVPIATREEAEACVRGMKRSPETVEAFIRKRNPRRLVQNPYKDKILLPSGNIQYVYGEEDVAKRQREKAQRIEGFKNREKALLRAVKRDVAKGDDTALAIGLIMTTYERPGNAESAKDGHYGVTGWECRHLSKEGKSAVALDYVGKSGVQQHKVVSDPALVRALLARQRACKRRGERLLDTSPSSINRYLADYGVRAKDLRTFGANVEMQAELTRLRKAGPRLSSLKPRDLKRTLKAEFMAAVATVAGKMGHTTTMLRRQYLVKEMEPTYIATGRVVKSFA